MSDSFESHIEALRQIGRRLLHRLFGSGEADDPFAAVRVPRIGKPPGRVGAIALEEPDGDVSVEVVGRRSA